MKMDYKTYQELLEIIELQRTLLSEHLNLIEKLINDNAEKENIICALMRDAKSEP